MEIVPVPLANIITSSVSEMAAKVAPVAQVLAAAAIGDRAVDPSAAKKGGRKTSSNEDRAKGGESAHHSQGRGDKINIDV